MAKFIITFQILLNLSGVGLFLYGWYFGDFTVMVVGGIILVADDIMTVYSGAMNILGPLIAWGVASFFISPWWYSLFWSSLVFNIFGVPGSIKKIITFKKRVQQLEEVMQYSEYR